LTRAATVGDTTPLSTRPARACKAARRVTPTSKDGTAARAVSDKQRVAGQSHGKQQAAAREPATKQLTSFFQPALYHAQRPTQTPRRFVACLAFQAAENDGSAILFWQARKLVVENRLQIAQGDIRQSVARRLHRNPVLMDAPPGGGISCLTGQVMRHFIQPVGNRVPPCRRLGLPCQ
jgi:hypothetical protein